MAIAVAGLAIVLTAVVAAGAFSRDPVPPSRDAPVAPSATAASTSTTLLATGPKGPSGCTVEQMVAPGDYEGVENLDDTIPRYVVFIPDSYHDIAPAPLFVFLTTIPLDSIDDTDVIRPSLGGLDGIIAVGSAGDSADIIEEVSHAFCIDPDRILTTQLPPAKEPSRLVEPDPSAGAA